tara:strand:- start:18 stop:794 length:777 start_codon:yes stop_codon:yes gene_type:complete
MSSADRRRYERRQILARMKTYGNTGYGSNINLDARSLDRLPGDFLADQTGYVFSTSPYAPSAEYESAGYQGTGSRGSGRGARGSNFYLFKKKAPVEPVIKTEYKPDPEQAAQIAELQKQLKILQDVPKYEPYDFSAERKEYEDRISGLNTKISDIQTGFQTQLADTTAKMSAERAAAEERLGLSFQSQLQASQNEAAQRQQQLTDQYRASLQASQTRPEVAGVRFATRGPAAQPRMQGISGTFGRRGSRLMKISALNV